VGDDDGATHGGVGVRPLSSMREELAGGEVAAAVLAVQGPQAHAVAQLLVELGVRAILNLSGELLVVPPHVRVTTVDLIGELLELCYYC
jgi:NADH/NAD ratio-sensing transcriptional regulator Rex